MKKPHPAHAASKSYELWEHAVSKIADIYFLNNSSLHSTLIKNEIFEGSFILHYVFSLINIWFLMICFAPQRNGVDLVVNARTPTNLPYMWLPIKIKKIFYKLPSLNLYSWCSFIIVFFFCNLFYGICATEAFASYYCQVLKQYLLYKMLLYFVPIFSL